MPYQVFTMTSTQLITTCETTLQDDIVPKLSFPPEIGILNVTGRNGQQRAKHPILHLMPSTDVGGHR